MKVYDVEDGYFYSQIHSVVAENITEVEKLWYKKYPSNFIKSIKLHSEYVLSQAKEVDGEMLEDNLVVSVNSADELIKYLHKETDTEKLMEDLERNKYKDRELGIDSFKAWVKSWFTKELKPADYEFNSDGIVLDYKFRTEKRKLKLDKRVTVKIWVKEDCDEES